ncbi:TenA family protein [Picrophilus oshimae]|uniref:Thiaminase (Transcriptional activator TenA) n=1 Tax=Picrophilus torridus (strain ATCC 700027 / DSM 9790 / JCM 10055 / NBRC 100828 / KAW 2/3) TaxID=1122961 RepID=A0A8G2FX49_PICTO|nr:TenA family protein [Picrophilus oshimae]SMD31089.1 thiaminase (transcriptional activator TenA) [Picrophilus oshimae DSM 9789]
MKLSDVLNDKYIKSTVASIMNHPFINEMSYGTLSDEKFKYYLIQDDIYLKYYKEAASVIYKNTGNDDIKELYEMIGMEEPEFHLKMLEMFKINKEDINDSMLNYTNYSYINHLKRWSNENDVKGMLAMFPCQWTYDLIAQNTKINDDRFKFWFDFYKNDRYHEITEKYLSIMEKLDFDDLYLMIIRYGTLYELRYWDDAYYSKSDYISS